MALVAVECRRRLTLNTILSVSKRNGPQPLPPILNRLRLDTNYEIMIWSLCTVILQIPVRYCFRYFRWSMISPKLTRHYIYTWSDYGRIYGYWNLNSANRSVIPRYRNFNAPKICTTTVWPYPLPCPANCFFFPFTCCPPCARSETNILTVS